MPQDHERKLKNYVINRSLQLRLIFVSLGYMAIILAVTLAFTLLPVLHTMFDTADPNAQYESAQTFLLLAQRLVPAVLVLCLFFFAHLVIMTHRICGPLVNFTHTFEAMADGDLSRRIQLRQKDYLQEEADMVNEVLDNLKDHMTALQAENDALAESLKKSTVPPEALDEARRRSDRLSVMIGAFHL